MATDFLTKSFTDIMKTMAVEANFNKYATSTSPALKMPKDVPALKDIKKNMLAKVWAFDDKKESKVYIFVEVDKTKFKETGDKDE
jgi:hypothetical protein